MTALTKILLVVLLLSLGFNFYEYQSLKKCNAVCNEMKEQARKDSVKLLGDIFCDNVGRIEPDLKKDGGTEIDEGLAEKAVIAYQKEHEGERTMYCRTGFIFSKQAFDHIFNNPNKKLNAVRLDLITDAADSLFIVAKGIRRDFMEVNYGAKSSRVFINQSMCPKDCEYQIYR